MVSGLIANIPSEVKVTLRPFSDDAAGGSSDVETREKRFEMPEY